MDTIDISGVCLHIESDEEGITILNGTLAYILVNIDTKLYRKYFVLDK